MDAAMHMTTLAADKVMTEVTVLYVDFDSDRILRTLLVVTVSTSTSVTVAML